MDIIDDRLAVIQPLNKFWYQNRVAGIDMLRLDLLHPVISGNKWYKLRLNMKHALEQGYKTVVTFGGGYSNHLVATAYAARMFGLRSVGIVRGNYEKLTPTLLDCRKEGMELIFVSKADYCKKEDHDWAVKLVGTFSNVAVQAQGFDEVVHFINSHNLDELFIVPEGGANEWGRAGAGLLSRFVRKDYSHVIVSVGTGTTLAGLRNKIPDHHQVYGFVPMKQGAYLKEHIARHLQPDKDNNWELIDEYHLGGFGKWNTDLLQFMNKFYKENNIPLDIIYTSKMMYGLHHMLENHQFSTCDKLLCIHTGGLQGNISIKNELIY